MPNPTKLIVDCSTGVTTEVELTDAEVAQREADAAAYYNCLLLYFHLIFFPN